MSLVNSERPETGCWWPRAESNHRHADFQSLSASSASALHTQLSYKSSTCSAVNRSRPQPSAPDDSRDCQILARNLTPAFARMGSVVTSVMKPQRVWTLSGYMRNRTTRRRTRDAPVSTQCAASNRRWADSTHIVIPPLARPDDEPACSATMLRVSKAPALTFTSPSTFFNTSRACSPCPSCAKHAAPSRRQDLV